MQLRTAVLAIAIVSFALPAASDVTIPKKFEAGTPAKAADVNANFTAVANAIDSLSGTIAGLSVDVDDLSDAVNAANGPTMVAVGGSIVGRYLGFRPTGFQRKPPPAVSLSYEQITVTLSSSPALSVMTSKGYLLWMVANRLSGLPFVPLPEEGAPEPAAILFDGASCQGNRYVLGAPDPNVTSYVRLAAPSPWSIHQGYVFGSPDPSDATRSYYVPANAPVATGSIASALFRNLVPADGSVIPQPGANCLAFPLPSVPVLPVLPNDPAVTGYSAAPGQISLVF